jgi:cellobiose phosphorylase
MDKYIPKYTIDSEQLVFEMLPSGDICQIKYQNECLSMYQANLLDGMLMNIFLRVRHKNEVFSTKLLGINSPSSFRIGKKQMQYYGEYHSVRYMIDFRISGRTWFWSVQLEATEPDIIAEVFYGQDVSLSYLGMNEAYVCQYLDHRVERFDDAYHIQTKQNQGPKFLLQQGSLTPNSAYCTDGFDFFGKEYKKDNQINALKREALSSRIYQYELAYIAFQTPPMLLTQPEKIIFYGSFNPDYQSTGRQWLQAQTLKDIYVSIEQEKEFKELPKIRTNISFADTYPFIPFSEQELDEIFPDKLFIEKEDGKILSWFTKDGTHYVTGEKEMYLERANGNIIANQGMREINIPSISSTNHIFGIFNSQICLGNTQFNQIMSRNQTPLNILKMSGQRLFLKYQGKYRLLTLPAVYEMYLNTSAWYYKIDDDIVKIEVGIPPYETNIKMEFTSFLGRTYEILLINVLDGMNPIEWKAEGKWLEFAFIEQSLTHQKYPKYLFKAKVDVDCEYGDDGVFFLDGQSRYNFLAIKLNAFKFGFSIYGVTSDKPLFSEMKIAVLKTQYQEVHRENCQHFQLQIAPDNPNYREIEKFNLLVPWYVHNALIHYAMPHGLEQYGGGAWGTRDVCQGPAELFMAFERYDLLKQVILKVYERQFFETYDWPQWFMFDAFEEIQADSSHGDIIVWPLYILSKYLLQTGDKDILQVIIPYTSIKTGKKQNPESLYQHVRHQIERIRDNFIPGTALSAYGGGDWDDTLQPVEDELRLKMSSSWTVALTIQALETYLFTCDDDEDLRGLLHELKKDYQEYFIKDGVPAGFVQIKNDQICHLVHPSDRLTGIKYRLLTFNRGMIAELFPEESLAGYLNIIDENLLHPDGVRLMDTTVKYKGGDPKIFIRAETATNFGREIGLQYVHAHIRYLEAMAKIGEAERLFAGLKVVNPILIKENVPNAITRQSNVYFSSSDGDFPNRYVADRDFRKLRGGEVKVKGGWRLYSSGPGIYLKQLISNFLGIKSIDNELYLDPVLPKSLNGLHFIFRYKNYTLNITYQVIDGNGTLYALVNGKRIDCNTDLNKYRRSGVIIPNSYLSEETQIIVRM